MQAGDDEQNEHQRDQHERAGPGPRQRPGQVELVLLPDEQRQALLGSLNGSVLSEFEPNAVMISGAVSPTARATPRITAVISPLRAVGSTIDQAVRHSGAPEREGRLAQAAGTSRSTTSAVRVTVGSIRIESASAAAKPENLLVELQ